MSSGNSKWGPVRLCAHPPRFAFHVTCPTKEVWDNDRRHAAEYGVLSARWPSTNACGEIRGRLRSRAPELAKAVAPTENGEVRRFIPEEIARTIRHYRESTRC